MRILIVNGHLRTGGTEKSLVNFLKNLDYDKNKVDLLLFEGLGEYLEDIPQEVNIISYDLRKTYGSFIKVVLSAIKNFDWNTVFLKIVMMLRSRITVKATGLMKIFHVTAKKYDCAIAYRVGLCNDYVSFAVKAKKKYMWWHHGEFNYDENTVKQWRKSLRNIDEIICVSDYSKELIQPHFPEHRTKMKVISNILDIENILRKSIEFNPYLNKEKKTIIVSVGRLSPEKKMINAVYAMDSLIKQGYLHIKWYLVGDGQEKEIIEKEIRDRGLEEFVICVGSQANPYPYINNADFYVHTSYVESQGISVLESMVLEKCGVVTRSRGVEEFIQDNINALLADQTVESLVKKIITILDNPLVLEKLKKNQLDTAKLYSADNIVKKIESLLEE